MRIARAWIDPFECDDWQHDDDTEASGLWFHDEPREPVTFEETEEEGDERRRREEDANHPAVADEPTIVCPIYWPTEDDGDQD
jgi:hypothetical protein